MAWERTIHPHCALYPTARLQMLRDLFYVEWAIMQQGTPSRQQTADAAAADAARKFA